MPKAIEFDRPLERRITLERNQATGEFEAAFSSEAPVARWFGIEVLEHSEAAINMERASGGLPLLLNHDMGTLLGRIQDFRLDEDKRTRGRVVFDEEDDEAMRWKSKIERGFAKDVSIRYTVDDHELTERKQEPDILKVTRWTPLEGSIVTVPADINAGFGRQHDRGDQIMSDQQQTDAGGSNSGNVVDFRQEFSAAFDSGENQGKAAERARLTDIETSFAALQPHFRNDPLFISARANAISTGISVEVFRRQLLDLINTGEPAPAAPIPDRDTAGQHISAGDDNMEKWARGIEAALDFRFGLADEKAKAAIGENPFAGLRLIEMGRSYLQNLGQQAGNIGASDVAKACLVTPGVLNGSMFARGAIISHSSSDFTDILANIAWKMMGQGYTQAAETWRPIVRVIPMPDYKEGKIPNLTAFTALDEIPDTGEYEMGTIGDVGEAIKIRKFGKLFLISRGAILNDDANAFTAIPRAMGGAAARKTGDLVWTDIVQGNPTLGQDSKSLFVSDHSNLAASGAAPSVTTLNTAYAAMARQKDPDGRATLNLEPRYLCVPPELAGTAQVLTTALQLQTAPGATSGDQPAEAQNRFTRLTPISEARLTNTTAWYLICDPNSQLIDTIAVAFLNGQETPFMEQEQGFERDGIKYKVRLEAAAAAVAYQGMYKNPGV